MAGKFELVPTVQGPAPKAGGGGSISRQAYNKVKEEASAKAKKALQKVQAVNEELKEEPERAFKGQVMGNIVAFGVENVANEHAIKNPEAYIAKNPKKATLAGIVLSEGLAYWRAEKGDATGMHAGMHAASHMAGFASAQRLGPTSPLMRGDTGYAPAAPAAAPAPSAATGEKALAEAMGIKLQGAPNPYDVGSTEGADVEGARRERRQQRRQKVARALSEQVGLENPDALQGADALQEHVEGLLDEASEVAGGPIEDGIYGDVGAMPLLMLGGQALANLLKSLPGLKAMAEQPEAVQKAATVQGITPGTDAFLSLSGYDVEGLTVEGKKRLTREERQLQRLERKQKRIERRKDKKDSKNLVNSGELAQRLEKLEKDRASDRAQTAQIANSLSQLVSMVQSNQASAPAQTSYASAEESWGGGEEFLDI